MKIEKTDNPAVDIVHLSRQEIDRFQADLEANDWNVASGIELLTSWPSGLDPDTCRLIGMLLRSVERSPHPVASKHR